MEKIAKRLVELCRKGDYETVHNELYDKNAVSIEPKGASGPERVEGVEAIQKKGVEFQNMMEEYHGNEVSDPLYGDSFFSVSMMMDATFKDMGRIKMSEICVYKVENEKIVSEQFFYDTPDC